MFKQLILGSLMLCQGISFAGEVGPEEVTDLSPKLVENQQESERVAVEQADCVAELVSHFEAGFVQYAAQVEAQCIETDLLDMTRIEKEEDVDRFSGRWVVFRGSSSRFPKEQDYYTILHDTLWELKAGYVTERTYDWKSGSGRVLYRVLKHNCQDYTYPLNTTHIKLHPHGLFMRNMSPREKEIIRQALNQKKAKVNEEQHDDCVLQ